MTLLGTGKSELAETDAVKFQLEIALTDEVSGLLVRLEVPPEGSFPPGKSILFEFPEIIQMADNRVAYIGMAEESLARRACSEEACQQAPGCPGLRVRLEPQKNQ